MNKHKLLSVVIPCYNAAAYMEHAVRSVLCSSISIEVLIVDDGSQDGTADIADRFQRDYPEICKAIHKNNGGHGDAILAGLSVAEGFYFDVLDSDDWMEAESFSVFLKTLETLRQSAVPPDLVIRNTVFEKTARHHQHISSFCRQFPVNTVFDWNAVRPFPLGNVVLLHSMVYRTALLKQTFLPVPKHTFYVDHLFAYLPLPAVRHLYYTNLNVYHYYLGRPDQSVTESAMFRQISHVDQVCHIMLEQISLDDIENEQQRMYMGTYLEMVIASTYAFMVKSGTPEHLNMAEHLISDIKKTNPCFWNMLSRRPSGFVLSLPRRLGYAIISFLFRFWRTMYGFS